MPDQEIVDLLTQIRDLQRQHLENYHQALEQQQKAIGLQRRALVLGPILILGALFLFFLMYLLTR
jgi:CHASE3 domain sensor protein